MVLVTQNQYILANKIHHIVMDEQKEHKEIYLYSGRRKTIVDHYWQITIIYTADDAASQNSNNNGFAKSSSNNDIRECTVTVRGAFNAHKAFKSLVQQIREQLPDQLYLDTALERMITDCDIENLKDRDLNEDKELKEINFDTKSKKVRGARKAKARSKKVLRKSKKRR